MDIDLFEYTSSQIKDFTNEIYLHIMGDPLVLSNIEQYLDIAYKFNLKVNITTSGFYIEKSKYNILTHKSIKQINISLNSFNANKTNIELKTYMDNILDFCSYKINSTNNIFVNLRLWNIDKQQSAKEFNSEIYKILKDYFSTSELLYQKDPIRLSNKILLCHDEYFEWPSLDNNFLSNNGFCLGLKSHIGILSNGVVVPCCLDSKAIINLGNIQNQPLKDIIYSKKAMAIKEGFSNRIAIEELCQKCTYKQRFNHSTSTAQ